MNTALLTTVLDTQHILGVDHFARPGGSYVLHGSHPAVSADLHGTQLDAVGCFALLCEVAADAVDVTNEAKALGVASPGCSYYRAEIPAHYEGYEAVMLLDEMSGAQLEGVRARIGHHGVELVASGIPFQPTTVLHIIVGEHEGNRVVFTWYPGRLTPKHGTVKLIR